MLRGGGHDNNTSLHPGELRARGDAAPMIDDGVPLVVDGRRQWVEYRHVDYDEDDFPALATAYVAAGGSLASTSLGAGQAQRVPMRELIDFGTEWIAAQRA